MERGTSWIRRAALLVSLFGLSACAGQPSPPPPSPTPAPTATGPGTGATVKVRFYSSIAFIPTGPTHPTPGAPDAPDVPMTDGTADSVLAVLPRAYRPSMLASPPVPNQPEFNPGAGKTHQPHHLMIKIAASLLGGSGTDEVVIPVRPPDNDTDVYDITIEGVGSGTGRLQYSGFSSVASILDGAVAEPPTPTKPSAAAASGTAALARMTLGSGWKLTVPTEPVAPPSGTLNFLQCPSGASCNAPIPAQVPERLFALCVQGESPPVTGPVAIKVSNGSTTVLRLPLTAADAPIAFKVLHAPLSEMHGGTMGGDPLHHFKLFYLLAEPIRRPYYYPAFAHMAAPLILNDPFCTPVAQFKAR